VRRCLPESALSQRRRPPSDIQALIPAAIVLLAAVWSSHIRLRLMKRPAQIERGSNERRLRLKARSLQAAGCCSEDQCA
jgi:hypothetical protein